MDTVDVDGDSYITPLPEEAVKPADLLGSGTKKADRLKTKIREAVFEEFDRSALLGLETQGRVELLKKHVNSVEKIALVACDIISGKRPDIYDGEVVELTPRDYDLVQVTADLHDAEKMVPERQLLDRDTPTGRNTEHASEGSNTRLLMHGEDSGAWSEQLLRDLGFNEKILNSIRQDIVTHMAMPFVENYLDGAQKDREKGKDVILPYELENNKFPLPKTVIGAIVYAADLLSPKELAGEEIEKDPMAGCLDRYIMDNLGWGLDLEASFKSSSMSLYENVKRLQNPRDADMRPLAAKVEKIIGDSIGKQAVEEVKGFGSFVSEGFQIDGTEFKGFKSLEVSTEVEATDTQGQKQVVKTVNIPKTMEMYYKAVGAYRDVREDTKNEKLAA